VCARPVTIPRTRLTHHRPLHAERVTTSTQPAELALLLVRGWLASADDAADPQALQESAS
jgi:hypothetical protein